MKKNIYFRSIILWNLSNNKIANIFSEHNLSITSMTFN